MVVKVKNQLNQLIEKITMQVVKRCDSKLKHIIQEFIRFFYSQASYADLAERGIGELAGIVESQFKLMYVKSPIDLKINIFNPDESADGWISTHTVIQVAMGNMPFLVDSLSMELNRNDITCHFMIYMGGMRVVRDDKGIMTNILPFYSEQNNSSIEAPIYVEIDHQSDPQVLQDLKSNLQRVFRDVALCTSDWKAMQTRMEQSIHQLEAQRSVLFSDNVTESIDFLTWMINDHFIFLGARDYRISGLGKKRAMRLVAGSGLGVLRNESKSKIYRVLADLPDQALEQMMSKKQPVLICKTRTSSTVHRADYTDNIDVLLFDKKGELTGVRRFIGLYTASAYSSNPKEIPIVRQKVVQILEKSELPDNSHAAKDFLNIINTFPRDDLFQATADELFDLCMGILHLQERRQTRLFVRQDIFGRYVSCYVYLPKENYNTDLLVKLKNILVETFHGVDANFNTHFSSSILVRINYIIRLETASKIIFDLKKLEQELIFASRSWQDCLQEAIYARFGEEQGKELFECYHHVFPASYSEAFEASDAIYDIRQIEDLKCKDTLGMCLFKPRKADADIVRFKLYRYDCTVPLSDALPMLENMGLRVIREQSYTLKFHDGRKLWINDLHMISASCYSFDLEQVQGIFQENFNQVWLGEAENDNFNRLVLLAGMDCFQIALLRAYSKYFQQIGFTFSHQYIGESLVNNYEITRLLVDLFYARFNPECVSRLLKFDKINEKIYTLLDKVPSLDEDKILRYYANAIFATLRTNYFQVQEDGEKKAYLSLKLDPSILQDMPLPLPRYEIFIYSAAFEGVHLRADKIARGGIRWSDRREDFRTEVLGLMKAQRVKNALIVPSGAKGGFVLKKALTDASRDELHREAVCCYKLFVNGLLDVTDNYEGEEVISHPNTVCYDESDTYIVVAADKGTATFSDIANEISQQRGYWLDDAFASGGSTGYDHKKMGITARGAWVSAERQFQEMGLDVDAIPISVMGIGDMAGDVFGNGLLMSPYIKLVAAFNHKHIFLDPNPSLSESYAERVRLFDLSKGSWDEYNPERISAGGGVYLRSAKSIKLTSDIKHALHIEDDELSPNDLIKEILQSPVDMIWNGGIGTFVKASYETHDDAGDRTNDSLRINATDLRCRVFIEGGNLGLTQLARKEFALNGGKINTDFIDNSAGVDCSDHEVNIKILLDKVIEAKELTIKARNKLLSKMTDEVAELVLQNNYHQNRLISQAAYLSANHIEAYRHFMNYQQEKGLLDCNLEFLPDNQELLKRKAAGVGLQRPELAILLAYSKIIIDKGLRGSSLINDPYVQQYVKRAFPVTLRKRYPNYMHGHRLEREIISTQLSNQVVSDMGITFCHQIQQETNATVAEVVSAYIAAQEIFNMQDFYAEIQSLDYKVDTTIQHQMSDDVIRLVRRAARWLLRNGYRSEKITTMVEVFSPPVAALFKRLPKYLLGMDSENFIKRRDVMMQANVGSDLAGKISALYPMHNAFNIVVAMNTLEMDVNTVAKTYFSIVDRLDLLWFRDLINNQPVKSHWTTLAKSFYKYDLDKVQRKLTINVLRIDERVSVSAKINAWLHKHEVLIERWREIVSNLRGSSIKDFDILSVAIRELITIVKLSDDIE